MKFFKSIFLAGVVANVALMGGTVAAQTKWDVPTSYAPTIFHTQNLQKMADEIEKASSGKLKLVVHSNASLFKLAEIKRAVQTGQAQMGEVLVGILENDSKVYGVDTVPFLATSYADALKLWKASRPVFEEQLSKQGLKLLYSTPWQPNALVTKKPLNSIADLKGLKWRTYNAATGRLAELAGGQPVTVPAAELAQAVATGTVEVVPTSSPIVVQMKLWESMPYHYSIDGWVPRNMVVANARAFNALDKQTQDIVLKAASEAETRGLQMAEETSKETLAIAAKNGMKMLPPPPQLKADLDRIGQTMLSEWLLSAGADGQKIIDAYRK